MQNAAEKKPAKPKKARKTLSKRQWLKIRHKWENDPRKGFHWLSRETAISKGAIVYHHKTEGWTKAVDVEKVPSRKAIDLSGRPTLYRDELCGAIEAYFDGEAFDIVPDDNNRGKLHLQIKKIRTMAGFAASVGVNRAVLFHWAHEVDENGDYINPKFHRSYQIALSKQEHLLLSGGLAGVYQSNVVQLVLRNHHFYQPLVANPGDNKGGGVDTDELDRIYETALQEAAERQKAIEGRFERLVGSGTSDLSYKTESTGVDYDD